MWKSDRLEGRAEIFLHWKNFVKVVIAMIWPLILALFLKSLVLKVVCWAVFLLLNIVYLPLWGPFITAIAVGVIPWYIFLEWKAHPKWLAIIAIIILLIEISYVRHRMRFVEQIRKKENLPF